MQFKLEQGIIFSHVLLGNLDLAGEVAETQEWIVNQTITATAFVNGVEIPAQVIEDWFHNRYKLMNEELEAKYADLDKLAEKKAEEILQKRANGIIDAMHDLQGALRDAGDLIKPHWDR